MPDAPKAQPARGRRADYAWFDPISTRWMDNDPYGHVNNAVYYAWIDSAVNRALIEGGALDIARGPVIGLVVESGCRYFAPISYPETVHAGVRVAHVGRSSVRYEVGLFRNDEDEAAAEGFFVHVYVDRESRRATPLPDPLRAVVEGLRRPPA